MLRIKYYKFGRIFKLRSRTGETGITQHSNTQELQIVTGEHYLEVDVIRFLIVPRYYLDLANLFMNFQSK